MVGIPLLVRQAMDLLILEHIRRCQSCGREMMSESAMSWSQNPYCHNKDCFESRIAEASKESAKVSRVKKGSYIMFSRKG
jgi:hypothetical protein